MKEIKFWGKKYKQKVKPLDCIICPYKTSCNTFECVSNACEITNECFANHLTGTWCPFGEIPKNHKWKFKY